MDPNRLTQKSQEALHDAQTKALRFGHAEVDGEHLLLALLDQPDGLVPRLLDRAGHGGRADDVADVIQHRLLVYAETTGALVPYYTERGILVAVDADQPPDAVTADISARLSGLSLTRPQR